MPSTINSMPDGPMELSTVKRMKETYEYAVAEEDSEEVVAVLMLREENVYGLGFHPDEGGWVRIVAGDRVAEEEEMDRVEDAIEGWVEHAHGESTRIVSPGERSKNRRPWEVEQGLEPEYDCPDCPFYGTGLSMGPHAFLDHLKDEHGYSNEEAFQIMNGSPEEAEPTDFDCPECDYKESQMTAVAFEDHLRREHGYSAQQIDETLT